MQALDLHPAQDTWPALSLRRIGIASALTVALGFGGLGLWAAFTPLDSAVTAQGLFVAAGKRKTVTLLDGGILSKLLVKEGEHVTAGQKLLLLDDVQLRTSMNQVKAQYWGAVAKIARLEAETHDRRDLAMPADLLAVASADPTIAALVHSEQSLFASRWDTFDGNARVSGRKIEQMQSQVTALQLQMQSLAKRLSYTREQSRTVEMLLKEGLETRSHALDLQRSIRSWRVRSVIPPAVTPRLVMLSNRPSWN